MGWYLCQKQKTKKNRFNKKKVENVDLQFFQTRGWFASCQVSINPLAKGTFYGVPSDATCEADVIISVHEDLHVTSLKRPQQKALNKLKSHGSNGDVQWSNGKNLKFTLPETNSKTALENRPSPKRKQSHSNYPFSGAKKLVSGRVVKTDQWVFWTFQWQIVWKDLRFLDTSSCVKKIVCQSWGPKTTGDLVHFPTWQPIKE